MPRSRATGGEIAARRSADADQVISYQNGIATRVAATMWNATKKSERSVISAMSNMNQDKKAHTHKDATAGRKRYSLKIKAAAVEDVKSGRIPAARVAAEHGVPAQTLSNWVRADRGAIVRRIGASQRVRNGINHEILFDGHCPRFTGTRNIGGAKSARQSEEENQLCIEARKKDTRVVTE